jgi:hypothetical protein
MATGPNDLQLSDTQLVERAVEELRSHLPDRWTVTVADGPAQTNGEPGKQILVNHAGTGGYSALVEARRSFTPQDARRLLGGPLGPRLRAMTGNMPIAVVAPYLSPRTREVLDAEKIGYIDLAGNIRLDLQNLYVEIERTARNPNGPPTAAPGLRGAKTGRVVRVLVDAYPPYGLKEIAATAGIDRGYTSRILESLSEQALIEREPRGKVTDVDWPALLRARAQYLDLLGRRTTSGYISPRGAQAALDCLARRALDEPWAVTGSFAAVRFAAVAAPALLVVYTMNPAALAVDLDLLEADRGTNVALVRPTNYGPFDRTEWDHGIRWAGLSQVALDCLSGNGRMPAEGEALLEWMAKNEASWRTTIDQMPPPARGTKRPPPERS